MDIQGKKCLVVGAGRSGIASSSFLLRKKALVTLTDINPDGENELLNQLRKSGLKTIFGHYPSVTKENFDLLIVSPGVPSDIPPTVSARLLGILVLGELELAYRFAKSPLVAITGTNGKTTTTSLIGEIFKAAGVNTMVGGNIGLPLINAVDEYGSQDMLVVEVSSFQLETVEHFNPKAAVVLNISPDHLDRHGSMTNYIAIKERIFARQEADDFTILNYDDSQTRAMAKHTNGKVTFFSQKCNLDEGILVREGIITIRCNKIDTDILPVSQLSIPGAHNLENALAATAAAYVLGVDIKALKKALKAFPGVEHRLKAVAEKKGVLYVNDSKGTNPDASIKALESYDRPIILIAGGRNKGSDFTKFAQLIKKKVRLLVVLGECATEIEQAAHKEGFLNILRAPDFHAAVFAAHKAAQPGDVVLLSPACASWDMFKNYEERGDLFKKIVAEL